MRPQSTPKSMRLHIGFFGRRNVGKSSLLNALTRQQVAIVSSEAGTTTDPVEKPMELLPLGPVVFIDTAGVDDDSVLGHQRVARTRQVLERTELAVVVCEAGGWGAHEEALLAALRQAAIPSLVVYNKADVSPPSASDLAMAQAQGLKVVVVSAQHGQGMDALRQALIALAPAEFIEQRTILGDLVPAGGLVMLVVPIDKEAPRGRLILPQVQALRDALDHDVCALVVKENGLAQALTRLKAPPDLVVTDSQAFREVAAVTPANIPMTSFSILFSRFRGDLRSQVAGLEALDHLRAGDRILVAEACTHHPVEDDIGRVKIPRWLQEYSGLPLHFDTVQGADFPADLAPWSLVVHCGGCMLNRRAMLGRIARCQHAGIPITNYGLLIARSMGILERALGPAHLWQDSD